MFENIFSTSASVWAGLASLMVALPILIHLINMMRHRKVKWAAMDFLLQSHKRQRNWVRLKQLLLLLARIAALLLALFMFGQVGCQNGNIAQLLGGRTTHHYILLDDSYSMGESNNGKTVFDIARETMPNLISRVLKKSDQRVTLIRFSQAGRRTQVAAAGKALTQLADIDGQLVDSDFMQLLEERRNSFDVSTLATGPQDALAMTKELILERAQEKSFVYVLSDFRAKEWSNPANQIPELNAIRAAEGEIQFINCVKKSQQNIGVRLLNSVGNIRAVNVPFPVKLEVENFGDTPINNLTVRVFSQAFNRLVEATSSPESAAPAEAELPSVFIQEIAPGKIETRDFFVFFSVPGRHAVRVQLGDDAINRDNSRWLIVDVATNASALVIDDEQESSAYFLSSAFQPGRAISGVQADVKTKEFLRDVAPENLAKFDSIFICGVDSLDGIAVQKLENYVRNGGGVCFSFGPKANLQYYSTELYRNGEGLLPLPVERIINISSVDRSLRDITEDPDKEESPAVDWVIQDHPLFAPFVGANDTFFNTLHVNEFVAPPAIWSREADPNTTIAATVRGLDRYPLVAIKRFGSGNVVSIHTSISRDWSDIQRNPVFLVTMLRIQEFLSETKQQRPENFVGQAAKLQIPLDQYQDTVSFVLPTASAEVSQMIERKGARLGDNQAASWGFGLGSQEGYEGDFQDTLVPGIYAGWATKTNGERDVTRWAFNVDPSEGDLETLTRRALVEKLAGIEIGVIDFDEVDPNPQHDVQAQMSRWLLILLSILLLGEQWLAFAASFHSSRGGARS